ncbi:MAG: HAMP domain-containing sensor histidine kinase [Bryobacteraceae bacterium]|nr:HAMP domain-containing sensor histidine kinase [Bryobacteraceae bacterium]
MNLFSTDPEMLSLCRDVVELPMVGRCTLRTFAEADKVPGDGVSIFDLPGGDQAAGPILDLIEEEDGGQKIVVVDRNTLLQFRGKLLMLQATVVLKPLTRARLEIAMEQALGSPVQRFDETLIRYNRDELLQHLLEANLRLQEHDQDRTNFLARAVHELRAPLTSLNGYCDLLLERRLGPLSSEQDIVISRMRHSLTRLSGIVSSMFQLSVGEHEAELPLITAGNYLSCIEQAIHEVSPLFEERRIDLTVHLAPPAGELEFDAGQMEQVIINVLDNSCKFTPRGGAVKVVGYPYLWEQRCAVAPYGNSPDRRKSGEAVANSYRLDVSDDGPGIAPQHMGHIFEEYAAFGDGSDRSGAGLGLAICRMIVKRHKGSIWAESSGFGATFSIVLPCV